MSPFSGVQNCSGFPGSTCASCSSLVPGQSERDRQTHSLHRKPDPQVLDFPLLVVGHLNRGTKDTDIPTPFPLQDPSQDDNTQSSSAPRYRDRYRCKCSGFCKFLASVSRLRRRKHSCWPCSRSWMAEQARQRGEHEQPSRSFIHRHQPRISHEGIIAPSHVSPVLVFDQNAAVLITTPRREQNRPTTDDYTAARSIRTLLKLVFHIVQPMQIRGTKCLNSSTWLPNLTKKTRSPTMSVG